MTSKSADAFRTISEVAEWLDTPTHVLRFWESKFHQIKPVKRAGGRRYFRPDDMLLLGGIKKLLHDDGQTINGVQKMLSQSGVKKIAAYSRPLAGQVENPYAQDAPQDAVPPDEPETIPQPIEAAPDAPLPDPPEVETEVAQSDDVPAQAEPAPPEPAKPVQSEVEPAEVQQGLDAFHAAPIPDPAPQPAARPARPTVSTGMLSRLRSLPRPISAQTAQAFRATHDRLAAVAEQMSSPRSD